MPTLKYENTVLTVGRGINKEAYIEKKVYDPYSDEYRNITYIEVKEGRIRVKIDERNYFIDSIKVSEKLENLVNEMTIYIEEGKIKEIPQLIENITDAIARDLEEEEKDFGIVFNNIVDAIERLASVLSTDIVKA